MELKGKKVIVTGSDGFIGSHLVEALLEEGVQLKVFCYYNSFNSWGWVDSFSDSIKKELEIFTGDIRDSNAVRTAVRDCDLVFHLAALIAIPYSYYSPESYVETNIKGTLNVLQAARDFDLEKVLITSTSEVYGTARYVPIDEKHPKQGQSPYSATKIGADHIAESFFRSFDLPVTIVRPFNTYGPRQSARAIIPTIVTQLLAGNTEIKLGSLSPTRDLLYVKDTVNGFIEIAKSDKVIGEEINIARNTEISMEQLASKIISMMGLEARIISDESRIRPKKSEVERLLGSNQKLLSLTNWESSYSLESGLEETINWFKVKENRQAYKAHIYNV